MATTTIKDYLTDNQAGVNSSHELLVAPSSSPAVPFNVYEGAFNPPNTTDSVAASYPNSTTEVYQFYTGGLSGTLLMTLTVIYADTLKMNITSVVRT